MELHDTTLMFEDAAHGGDKRKKTQQCISFLPCLLSVPRAFVSIRIQYSQNDYTVQQTNASLNNREHND